VEVVVDMVATLRRGDLLARLRAVLLSPKRAWSFIAVEAPDPVGLYLRVVLPLAAVPPLAKLISWSLLFGFITPGLALAGALLSWALSIAGVALLALIAAKLAPYFEGEDRVDQALKLVAYSATASWLGGIFRLVPVLGILSIATSLYSVYLLYSGAPQLLGIPATRALSYTVAVAGAAVLLYVAFALLMATLLGLTAFGMA
jgi:hypothetical protein